MRSNDFSLLNRLLQITYNFGKINFPFFHLLQGLSKIHFVFFIQLILVNSACVCVEIKRNINDLTKNFLINTQKNKIDLHFLSNFIVNSYLKTFAIKT